MYMSGVPLSSCLHHSYKPSLGTHPTCASGFQLLLVHRLIEGKECLFANEPEKNLSSSSVTIYEVCVHGFWEADTPAI